MLTSPASDCLARSPSHRVRSPSHRVCSVQRLPSTVHYARDVNPRGVRMVRRFFALVIGSPFFAADAEHVAAADCFSLFILPNLRVAEAFP